MQYYQAQAEVLNAVTVVLPSSATSFGVEKYKKKWKYSADFPHHDHRLMHQHVPFFF
jgi:hypothetical protein